MKHRLDVIWLMWLVFGIRAVEMVADITIFEDGSYQVFANSVQVLTGCLQNMLCN